ncbi:hypothetical protein [Novosphingobium sp.]|uniref:hypothetical protein n=1 Tax=Novosphingobium sp. TaxID=1874826 RepID=UPI00333EDC5D
MPPRFLLWALKLVHTIIWVFFVAMIAAIWVFAAQGDFAGAALAIAMVLVEVAILGLNHGHCPLGKVAQRYTADRAANFDICLPAWLAARTKPIFGPLFVGGILFAVMRWATMPR